VVGAAVLGLPGYVSISRRDVAPVAASADVNPAAEDRQSPQKSSPSPARPEDPAAPAVAGGPAPASGRLADLLADPAVRSNDHAAFASVYSRWALEYQSTPGGPGCEPGRGGELDCLFQAGSWSLFKDGTWDRLRRFDLPAILELATPTGERHRVALVALAEESATLVLGEREHTFPLGEIDRLWDGTFLLLWKAPPIGSRLISPGMRGKDVEWLRARLDALEGKVATGPRRDVYDEELRQRVLAFQRSWSLIPDGLVGEETLTQLTLASREPGTPSLSRRTP
jgi:general secretion pathway protein A